MTAKAAKMHVATEADRPGMFQVSRLTSEIGEDGSYTLAPAEQRQLKTEDAALEFADELARKTGKLYAVSRVIRVRRSRLNVEDVV